MAVGMHVTSRTSIIVHPADAERPTTIGYSTVKAAIPSTRVERPRNFMSRRVIHLFEFQDFGAIHVGNVCGPDQPQLVDHSLINQFAESQGFTRFLVLESEP